VSSELPGYGTVRYCPAGHRLPAPGVRVSSQPMATFRVRRDARRLEINGQEMEWPADELFVRRCTVVVRIDDPNTGREVSILCGQEWIESTVGAQQHC